MCCNIIAAYDADPPGVPMPLIEALLRDARARLNSAGGEAVDADLLLAHALGRGRSWLYAHAGDDIDDATAQAFATLVQRRSEEHTSELQSLMRISYAVFCLNKKKKQKHC